MIYFAFLAYFRTDSEYQKNPIVELRDVKIENDFKENEPNLKQWEPEHDHPIEHHDMEKEGSTKWAPDEMFKANEQMGVQSTYTNIEIYST